MSKLKEIFKREINDLECLHKIKKYKYTHAILKNNLQNLNFIYLVSLIFFLRQGLTIQFRLALNSIQYRLASNLKQSSCLRLLSAGFTDLCHYAQLNLSFLKGREVEGQSGLHGDFQVQPQLQSEIKQREGKTSGATQHIPPTESKLKI